jgi:glycopeptide antibiotics resistance protein
MVNSGVRTRRQVWLLPVGVYLLAVAYLTLAPRFGTSGASTPNFVPFASIFDLLFDSAATPAGIVKNLVGNLVLLAPLAVFIYVGLRWTVTRTLGAVAVTSLLIELMQGLGLTDGRQANVDDLLLNLAGAALALLALRTASRSDA